MKKTFLLLLILSTFLFPLFLVVTNVLFAQSVKEEWGVRYNGIGNGDDYGRSIAVDIQGNIYVVGSSIGNGSYFDIVTIKYNSLGEEQWIQRYNGTGNDTDYVSGMVINDNGDIFVIGSSKGKRAGRDIVTIKYNSDGEEKWVQRYNGSGNGSNYPKSIVIDKNNNVYVVGSSEGLGTEYDIVTIKYNSNGDQLWVSRYEGSGRDMGESILIDKKGAIYVTGSCKFIPEENTSNNISQWDDLILIKYDSSGTEQWKRLYDGPINGSDCGTNLAIDLQNNIYVTGVSEQQRYRSEYITIKYDSEGTQLWIQMYEIKGTVVIFGGNFPMLSDNQNNIYITGWILNKTGNGKDEDFTTIKYNSSGVKQWLRSYNGPDNDRDDATAMTIDNQGNIYIAGMSISSNSSSDCIVVKYNSSGERQWIQQYDGNANGWDILQDIKVDNDYNVYVTGLSMSIGSDFDVVTLKYSQNIKPINASIKLADAQKAFSEGNYLLVIELLKDFQFDDPLYSEAVMLMNQAIAKLPNNNTQNFVTVSGSINCGCSKAISGYVVFEDMNTRVNVGRCGITSDGYYCIVLPSGRTYSYYIDSKDFYPSSRIVDFSLPNQLPNYKDNITLVSYEEMKEKQTSVRINNIFFDFNESKLKSESFLELDRLYKFLSENTDISVEISGHTDNVGSDEYNITLSNARANAVKDYLVSKGINANKITSKGYGKSKPVATNDTDEGRQLNRRVEFKILKK
ncbi:MAG TPA: SBBP repeat-containing protein [Ignavibacteria bacterium]